MPFIPHSETDVREMLDTIGVGSIEDLFDEIPANLRMGESRMELGGLWILDADIDFGMGDHSVSFDEPLAVPVAGVRLDTSLGVLRVDRLGNASPADAWIKHSIDTNSGVGLHFQIIDVDHDGLLDIVTSNKKGVHYFQQVRVKN